MSKFLTALCATALWLTPATADEVPGIHWEKDYNKAKEIAKKEGKKLVLNFTGSDWCGWCHRLRDEVFVHPEFFTKASEKYVFVELDFPKAEELKKAVVDPELNERLKNELSVRGFPTLVLTTAEGQPYASTGYQPGGPEKYLENLQSLEKNAAPIFAVMKDEKALADKDKVKSAISALKEAGFLGAPAYSKVVDAALKLDPEGKLGLKPMIEAHREAAEFEKLVQSMGTQEEPDWQKLYDHIKAHPKLEGHLFAQVTTGVADHFAKAGDKEKAKELFDIALKQPEVQSNPQWKEFVEKQLSGL